MARHKVAVFGVPTAAGAHGAGVERAPFALRAAGLLSALKEHGATVVNLSDLGRFESGAKVTPELLASHRLSHGRRPVKILGDGEIGKPLEVSAHKFSASAQAKIEAAGGRCEVIPR